MKAVEMKFQVPKGVDAGGVDRMVRMATEIENINVVVLGTTVHSRYAADPFNRDQEACTNVIADSDRDVDKVAGATAVHYGLLCTNVVDIGDGTLNLKGKEQTVDEFKEAYDI